MLNVPHLRSHSDAAHVRDFLTTCTASTDDELIQPSLDSMTGVYLTWCELRGETPLSDRRLTRALRRLGVKPTPWRPIRRRHARRYRGVRLTGPLVTQYILGSLY
ncbi:hypothetical protein KIH31_17040 [Paenarthrobacter sp. DKR-5]|uniref:hypothetical protein n=1 Tax=Paenarthrobacter sp. DKR-5 TaxID=2835535 RepID=UPI001BDBCBA9|nr:hypothetical protein [Paenarthrobacter sp. DKR-5]MBT1004295.1 hypothetical protein [Paenarthrobacter sp. DKR-5]